MFNYDESLAEIGSLIRGGQVRADRCVSNLIKIIVGGMNRGLVAFRVDDRT